MFKRPGITTRFMRSLSLAAMGICLTFTTLASFAQAPEKTTILLKFKKTAVAQLKIEQADGAVLTGISSLDNLSQKYKLQKLERIFRPAGKFKARHEQFGLHLYYKLTFAPEIDAATIVQEYGKDAHIELAQLNHHYQLFDRPKRAKSTTFVPNDPQFAQQWHFHNTGQTGGTLNADINTPEAWDIEAGDSTVVVSDLDTGQDLNHPDLAANIWRNPGEIAGNNIDDDGNGYVDDVHGWDFSDDDNNPNDYHDHGTHTAGTVAAVTNNSIGVAGIAFNAKIMPCKIFPFATDDVIAEAFKYAADNGSRVSTNSWGNTSPTSSSPIIEAAIDYFIATTNGVVVFAAGNASTDDPTWGYPASYPPVIAVAATDHNDVKAYFSNYGNWVDISAPGVNVTSTVINGYDSFDGTSMACPHVAGAAALLFSAHPEWSGAQVRAQLEASADNIDGLNPGFDGLLGKGRLNAFEALNAGPFPNSPDSLRAEIAGNEVHLTWHNPTKNSDGSPINLHHINVFRDHVQIAKVGGAQTFTDLSVANGQHTYWVTATTVDSMESAPSNTVTLLLGDFDCLIWLPADVTDANLAEKARERGLSETQVRSLVKNPTSHLALKKALRAHGKNAFIVSDVTGIDLSQYEAVFAIMGIFPNNHRILAESLEAQALQSYISDGGRVYLEGGDVWYFDLFNGGHNFGPLFGIQGLADGIFDFELQTIVGVQGSYTQNLNFPYNGGNRLIDHLEPIVPAFTIHENSFPTFNCGIAHGSNNYRTIGTSFQFGGLSDSSATKVKLMAKYLTFFGLKGFNADFVGSPTIGFKPLQVVFNDLSTGEITNWNWSFPGGSPASATGPGPHTVIYNSAGNFKVGLTASGPDTSNTKVKAGYVKVFTPPDIKVTPLSFTEVLVLGDSITRTLTIANTGEGTLDFNIAIKGASAANTSVSVATHPALRDKAAIRTDLAPDETAIGVIVPAVGALSVKLPFYDGFESGNFNQWTNDGGSGTKEVTNATSAAGEYSFYYNNTGFADHFYGIHQDFEKGTQPKHISFYIRSGSTSKSDAYFVLTTNQWSNTQVIWFFADNNGFLYINDDVGGDNTYPYQPLQWYHIEFKDVDWTAKNFDYYVDGTLIKADIPFRNPVNDIDRLYLYNYDYNSEAWWDQINIGGTWITAAPFSGSVLAGSSLDIHLKFNSTGLNFGDHDAKIVIASNDPDEAEIAVPAHLTVAADAVIWIPDEVITPNLAAKARERHLPLAQVQSMSMKPTSHDALAAALQANGKTVQIINKLTASALAESKYLFVVLGVFPNSRTIKATDPEGPIIKNFLAGGGRVYLEGGDVWYYDPQFLQGYNFGPLFGVHAEADGANDLKTVMGGCFAENMNFVYKGANNSIDRISPLAGACALHNNLTPAYSCGVANGGHTIANAFQFGGLADNSLSAATQKDLMAQYLRFVDPPVVIGNVTVTPNQIKTHAEYTIPLTLSATGALAAEVDAIFIRFPDTTIVPSNIPASQVAVNGVTVMAGEVSSDPSTRTVKIITPVSLANQQPFKIVFKAGAGLINPPSPGDYTLQAWTTAQSFSAGSPAYSLAPAPGNAISPLTKSGYKKSNQSKVFYHDSQWWAIALYEPEDCWYIWRYDGTSWLRTNALDKGGNYRFDAIVQAGNNKLFLAGSHKIAPSFRRFSYAAGAWNLDPGFPAKLADFTNVDQVNPISLVQARNDRLWLFRLEARKLQALSSSNGGVTWSALITLKTNLHTMSGTTDAVAFQNGGNNYVGVGYAETDTAAGNSQFGFLLHRDSDPDENWTDESAKLSFFGNERATNNLCMAVAPNNNVYLFTRNARFTGSDPRNTLYKRSNTGVWQKFKVNSGAGLNWKSPAISIDATNKLIYLLGVNVNAAVAQSKTALIGQEASFESAPVAEMFSAAGANFDDLSVPAANIDPLHGLMITIDNLTANDIWYRHLPLRSSTPITISAITVAPNQANANASYSIPLTLSNNGRLVAGAGAINVRFPENTLVPNSIPAGSVLFNSIPASAISSNSATRQVTITTPVTLANNFAFNLVFKAAAGLVNPTIVGDYQLTVWTSSQPAQVNSLAYSLTPATTTVTPATVTPMPPDPNTAAAYFLSFNLGPQGRLLPGNNRIVIKLNNGTKVRHAVLHGVKVNEVSASALGDSAARQITITVPAALALQNSAAIKIFLPKPALRNPSTEGFHTLMVWTSVETTTVVSKTFSIHPTFGASILGAAPRFDCSNQSKMFYYDGVWWVTAASQADGKWYLWKLNGTTWTQSTFIHAAPKSRPDCQLVSASDRVYILLPGSSATSITRLNYNAGNWTVDAGYPKVVPDFVQNDDRGLGFIRPNNGELWVFMISGGKLLGKRSSDNGLSWSPTIVVKSGLHSSTGLTDAAQFAFSGKQHIGVSYAESAAPGAIYGFVRHAIDDPDSAWTDETAGMQQFPGTTASAQLSMRAYKNTILMLVKTSGGANAVHVGLFRRHIDGSWYKYPVFTSNAWTQPTLALDESNDVLYVIGSRIGAIRTGEMKKVALGQYDSLLTAKVDTVFKSGAENFANPSVAAHTLNDATKLLIGMGNETRGELWYNLVNFSAIAKNANTELAQQEKSNADNFEGVRQYPNPFNPDTFIHFKVKENSPVKLQIFNLSGQWVRTLADGDFEAGVHQRRWNGRDHAGQPVSSGIYFYRLQIGAKVFNGRMQLLK